jgi:hypothetical protein
MVLRVAMLCMMLMQSEAWDMLSTYTQVGGGGRGAGGWKQVWGDTKVVRGAMHMPMQSEAWDMLSVCTQVCYGGGGGVVC